MAECRKRFMGRTMKSVAEMVLAEDGIDLGAISPTAGYPNCRRSSPMASRRSRMCAR
jgi:hypothetical protein